MEALECLFTRRSVRKYKSRQIKDDDLSAILRAGSFAPSGKNQQSAIIVALQDKADIETLEELNKQVSGRAASQFYGAPTVLVVLARADSPFAVQDGSLVLGNLFNAANALGLGSCWVNRAKEVFDLPEGKALLEKWGIEGDYVGVGHCILGYADESPKAAPRKEHYTYIIK